MLKIYAVHHVEGFDTINNDIIKQYNIFKEFYNTFMPNWKKSIITSMSSEIKQEPLTSPKQVSSSKPPVLTNAELNAYILTLPKELGQLPKVSNLFPDELDSIILSQIIHYIPQDATTYKNALKWMNKNISDALSTMKEGFEDECKNMAKCMALEQKRNEENVLKNMKTISADPELKILMDKNIELFKKSDDIKKRAESGQLAGDFADKMKSKDDGPKYDMPEGGDYLTKLKKLNPIEYKKLEKNPMANLKMSFEQINANII